jgi:hypothetical protein
MAIRKAIAARAANHIFIVNDDGTVAVVNTLREEKVTAFSGMVTDGTIRSVAVLGPVAYFLVERDGIYTIEALDPDYHLDGAIKASSATVETVWSGLDHLEGRTVIVICDDVRIEAHSVSAGTVTLSEGALSVEIGLPFDWEIEPLPPPDERARNLRIVEAEVDVYQSAGVQVNDQPLTATRFGRDELDAVPIETGVRRINLVRGYGARPSLRVHGDAPWPVTIRSIKFYLDT